MGASTGCPGRVRHEFGTGRGATQVGNRVKGIGVVGTERNQGYGHCHWIVQGSIGVWGEAILANGK